MKLNFGSGKTKPGRPKKSKFNIEPKQIPLIAAAVIILVGLVFYNNVGIMGNLVILGIIIGVTPYVLFSYLHCVHTQLIGYNIHLRLYSHST